MDYLQTHWFPALSFVLAFLAFVFHLGGRVTSAQNTIVKINRVEHDVTRRLTELEEHMDEKFKAMRAEINIDDKDIETKINAVDAKYNLLFSQSAEYRESVGRTYATNIRVDNIEARFTAAVDRLLDKFDAQSAQILKAIQDLHYRR